MAGQYGRNATPQEVQDAAEAIRDETYLRMRAFALPLIAGTGYAAPEELVHDALAAVLAGRRKWGVALPFEVFLYGAMKSMASNDRTSARARREQQLATAGEDDTPESELADAVGETVPSVEQQLIDDERAQALERDFEQLSDFFKDDAQVQYVVMGREDGLKPAAIQASAGMTPTEYDTACRRLRRGLERLFGKRSKT